MHKILSSTFIISALLVVQSHAGDIAYKPTVTLKVGQSVILKGVRSADCGDMAPSWGHIKGRLPKSKLGSFSDGGTGTVKSGKCGDRVGARGVKFKAIKSGQEQLTIYQDKVRITVK